MDNAIEASETQDPSLARCWICGDPADSREHRFKRSDLARAGKTWSRDDQPFLLNDTGIRRIQGPGSRLATFGKVICQPCNTTRTQPYDRAYDTFSDWAVRQDAGLMARDELDFAEIYGAAHEVGVANLLRYFVKLFGCRIVDSGNPLPPNLAAAFTNHDFAPFGVSFALNATSFGGLRVRGGGILGNFPIIGMYRRSTDEVLQQYISGSIVGYLDIIYRYDYPQSYSWEGDIIEGSRQRVRLGRYNPETSGAHPANGDAPEAGPT